MANPRCAVWLETHRAPCGRAASVRVTTYSATRSAQRGGAFSTADPAGRMRSYHACPDHAPDPSDDGMTRVVVEPTKG